MANDDIHTPNDDRPHRRHNPLNGRHILVSPHRAKRPWLGQEDIPDKAVQPKHDPNCYLCPRNDRIGGETNPDYQSTYVFDNDFPAILEKNIATDKLLIENTDNISQELFKSQTITGVCKVICFSPDHSLTLPDLSHEAMCDVINSWCNESIALGQTYKWVQVFENKGAMMGCSNPHPHGQIWATDFLPDEAQIEDEKQKEYFKQHKRSMLLDVVEHEITANERIVFCNDDWAALVPYWAAWPFETLLLPRFAVTRLPELTQEQRQSLAQVMQKLTRCYDNLFGISFPYSMGWHGAPFDGSNGDAWQLHAHFYPPLLRSATVRKFMVGYEMMAEAQRDLTPEQAAERLRQCL